MLLKQDVREHGWCGDILKCPALLQGPTTVLAHARYPAPRATGTAACHEQKRWLLSVFFLDFGSCLMILACYSSRHLLQCPCSARWESALTTLLGPTVGVPGHTSSFGFPRRPIEDWRIPSFFFLWRGTHCGLRGWRQQTVWSGPCLVVTVKILRKENFLCMEY